MIDEAKIAELAGKVFDLRETLTGMSMLNAFGVGEQERRRAFADRQILEARLAEAELDLRIAKEPKP